ncbi:hypothetical protein [Pyxidicoccus caerfyrddinensis]|uniref:hypothetical protein n=1 Tax=Pyxidicoccus caerfyrddinensis TaxID=2709663 RepID=UPI0013DD2443|nr:hypothetical protein [Pyxidicoccus caerfyrddinensis]
MARRVSEIWPTSIKGEQGVATVSLADFDILLEGNRGILRATTVLYLCSAFENALSGFYVLCGLKDPPRAVVGWTQGAWPSLRGTPGHVQSLLTALKNKVSGPKAVLKGPYSKRLAVLENSFGIKLNLAASTLGDLDKWHSIRHAIAHDQGLAVTDEVFHSSSEVLSSRHHVQEADWKTLIALFDGVIDDLDRVVAIHLGREFIISLAVARYRDRAPTPTLVGDPFRAQKDREDKILHDVKVEWQMAFSRTEFRNAMQALGEAVSPPKTRRKAPRQPQTRAKP